MKSLVRAWLTIVATAAAIDSSVAAVAKSAETPPATVAVQIVDNNGRAVSESSLTTINDPWAAAARARRDVVQQRIARGDWNRAITDFDVELAGHQALVTHWRSAGSPTASGARELLAIADAGFLEEYVLETQLVPGFTLSREHIPQIDLPAYQRWRSTHELPKLGEPTLTIAAIGTQQAPVPADATLPPPERFAPQFMPCAESRAALERGVAAWRAIAATQRAAPLEVPETFVELDYALALATSRNRGVTFVAGAAPLYMFFAGWCAVDRQDWEAADPLLREAVQLTPWRSMPKLELAQVAIMRKRYADADTLVDEVLAFEHDPCLVATAWRKRGYIRFDEGRLEESRKAYLKSLVYDPDSQLAHSELALLNGQIQSRGGKPKEWTPLPGEQMTTTCRASRQQPST